MEKISKYEPIRRSGLDLDGQLTINSTNNAQGELGDRLLSHADVAAVLQKHVRIAEKSYDEFVKSQLARARRQGLARPSSASTVEKIRPSTSSVELPATKGVLEETSPFAEISWQAQYMPTRSKKRKRFTISSHCGGSISPAKSQQVEIIRYGNLAVDVPGYTFHVQLQSNVVTENDTKLNFNPNELQFEDPEWSLEEYEDELKEHFTGGLLEQRAKPLQNAERAKYLRPFMFRALEETGCSTDVVLRYFLEPNLDSPSKQRHQISANKEGFGPLSDKSRSPMVLLDLSATTNYEQSLAGYFCEAFEKATKFSAWYLVKDLYLARAQKVVMPSNSDVGMCRLCFRYSCTTHGEFKDDERHVAKRRRTIQNGLSNKNHRLNVTLQPRVTRPSHKMDTFLQERKQCQSYKFWKSKLQIYRNLDENLPVNYARGQFYPCNHDGPCEQNNCQCFKAGVNCEKSCGCHKSCQRRFRGCDCTRRDIPCSPKGKCVCRMMDRECDPDLCESCGAAELLDPRRFDDKKPSKSCSNVGIQRGIPKRMLIGSSPVSGFGLFMVEKAHKGEYLAEYKGELISQGEARRRQILHQYLREYLFELNRDQQIDGLYAGNKLRFINNSCKPKNINCDPIPMFCNGVVRMGLFATQTLHPGDELFFNYGYTDEQMEDYKEPPSQQRTLSKSAGQSHAKPKRANTGTSEGLLGSRKSMTAAPPAFRPSPLAGRVIADSDDAYEDNILDSDIS